MQDMPMGWYTRRREENAFSPESEQLYGQMAAEWLTWESERTGSVIRHQINGREKRIGKLLVDGFFLGHSCTGKEVNDVKGKTMTCRDPKEYRVPTSLCQGRRAVGMRVERDETRSSCKEVGGFCISPTPTRAVDDDY